MSVQKNIIPNINKEVILQRNSSTDIDKDSSWRNFFKTIVEAEKKQKDISMLAEDLDETAVNSNICLLMEDQVSELGTNNEYPKVLDTINNSISGLSSSNEIVNTAFQAVKGLRNIAQSVGNIANIMQQLRSTSGVGDNKGGFNNNSVLSPWFTNVKAWNNSSVNLSFKYAFKFAMGQYGLWNAREEVFLPVLNLMAPTMIRNISTLTTTGPYPTITSLVARALDEDTLSKSLSEKDIDAKINENSEYSKSTQKSMIVLEELISSSFKDFTYSISFGNFLKFNRVMIENSSYSFSAETDQYGYPVSGQVTLDFSSIVPISMTSTTEETQAVRMGISHSSL